MVDYTHYSPFWQKEAIMEQENYNQEQETEVVAETAEVTAAEEVVEEVVEVAAEEEETEEISAQETETEEVASEEIQEEPAKKEKKNPALWQMVVAGIASALLLVALGLLLLHALGFEIVPKSETPSSETQTGEETPGYVPAKVYTATEDAYNKHVDDVVATVNGKKLTNGKLQVFYSVVVNDFMMNYYSYLSSIGLDYTQPLSQQKCYFEEDKSWEEYFVNAALETWINYQSVSLLAEEAGYVMPDDIKEALAQIIPQLEEQAKELEYESAAAMVKDRMHCTLEEYVDYWTMYQIGADFTGKEPTRDELEAYYEKNKETMEASGITKDSGPIVDVRHILVMPKGGKTDESGNTTYSKEEWNTCKETAEQLLKEWKNGEATEESFAALANEKSEDGGSNTNGGLYEGVTKDTQFVEPFLNWCMDEKNKVGDTGIVKTDYGYHIMYLSSTEEYWVYEATMLYINEKTMEMIEEAKAKWPAESDMDKICLMEVEFA